MLTADSIDMTGYNRFVEGLHNALIGTGQNGDMALVARSEAAQINWGIAVALGPKTKEKGERAMERDVKREFAPGPAQAFEQSKRKSVYGETNITWLYAGPSFLVGVRDEDVQPGLSESGMRAKMKTARTASFPRGKAWPQIGMRGKQHVKRLNRTVISRDRFAALLAKMYGRLGLLKARFAHNASELGKKTIPKWLRDHFGTVGNDGTSILRTSPAGDSFYLEFGARGPGLVSNPRIQKAIHRVISERKHKLRDKMEKILQGYTYDYNTGRVFRRHRGEEMIRELEANEELFNSL